VVIAGSPGSFAGSRSRIGGVKAWWNRRRERSACNEIRRTLALFGYPLAMTDEEIKAGLARVVPIMRRGGVSGAEFAARLRAVARA
jgi:hypothetical protein